MTKEESENERQQIAAAQKDSEHFAVLYDRYYYRVFMFCYHRTGSKTEALDLTSQTFLKAMVNLHQYTFRGVPFSAWLLRIATNEVNNFYRRQKRKREVGLLPEHVRQLAGDAGVSVNDNTIKLLVNALNQLSAEEAQLLELRFFEGCSFADIANIYNISEASAKMRVYRILKRMKVALSRMERR